MTRPVATSTGLPALDMTTGCEAFQQTAQRFADAPALRALGDDAWVTWGEYAERVRGLAAGLHAAGVAVARRWR